MIIHSLLKKYSFYALLLFILTILAFQKYRYHENGWRSELWADQGGYYVLLPTLFIYDFDAKKAPSNIDDLTGNGFFIDTVNNKINTRYTYGVALLQAPFFILIHYCTNMQEEFRYGFSDRYYQVPNMAALFYSFIGIIFMIEFLKKYFNHFLSIITASCIFLGTNLFYYSVEGTGMSHVYSFSMFALFLFLTTKLISTEKNKLILFFLWSLIYAVILLIRPINFVILLVALSLDCTSFKNILQRIKEFTNWKDILIFSTTIVLMFFPQFLYWQYLTGSWVYYTYGNETFSNWNAPKIFHLLFAPNNGLILYNPLYLVIIAGMVYMIIKKINNGLMLSGIFLLLLYIGGAWFSYCLACGFGGRGFVEYTALFGLPLGYLIQWIFQSRKTIRFIAGFLVMICLFLNLKLGFTYDKCFTNPEWDFEEYSKYIIRGVFYKKISPGEPNLTPEKEFSKGIYVTQKNYTLTNFRRARIKANIEFEDPNPNAELVLQIEKQDSTIYWISKKLNNKEKIFKPKQSFLMNVDLPKTFDLDSKIVAFVWNKEKKSLKLNSLELLLK
jgi:hypothetical protein